MNSDFLLYDGECPVCRTHVAVSRLRRLYPGLRILNARAEPALVEELRGKGYEINDGIVLCLDGAIHSGADAMRTIAVLGRRSPSLWRRALLSLLAAVPYPWLARARLVLLRLLRREPIG